MEPNRVRRQAAGQQATQLIQQLALGRALHYNNSMRAFPKVIFTAFLVIAVSLLMQTPAYALSGSVDTASGLCCPVGQGAETRAISSTSATHECPLSDCVSLHTNMIPDAPPSPQTVDAVRFDSQLLPAPPDKTALKTSLRTMRVPRVPPHPGHQCRNSLEHQEPPEPLPI